MVASKTPTTNLIQLPRTFKSPTTPLKVQPSPDKPIGKSAAEQSAHDLSAKILLDLSQKVEELEFAFAQLEPLVQPLEANNWKVNGLNNAINDLDRRVRSLEVRNTEILKLERNLFRKR
jgi:hypothetical protein